MTEDDLDFNTSVFDKKYIDDQAADLDITLVKAFEEHPIHEVLRICAQMRPSVDIFVE